METVFKCGWCGQEAGTYAQAFWATSWGHAGDFPGHVKGCDYIQPKCMDCAAKPPVSLEAAEWSRQEAEIAAFFEKKRQCASPTS